MIKISQFALATALLTHRASAACEGTISTFTGTSKADCTYANFLTNLSPDCNVATLFPDLDPATEVAEICEYDAPTQFVEIQGYYQDDKRYFSGGGSLVDGENFGIDSAQIKRFEANAGSNQLIDWPQYAARIDYNAANGLSPEGAENGYPANMNLATSCQLQTAMCCFTDDSIGDAFPVDKDTDVCRHDLLDSPQSNHIEDGWSVFPGGETSTYCVGFTWTDGTDELIGNMMYDVSLRNTALHGFRGGVPGAPMCGCVEHMPEVESAECRTASKASDITFTFDYDARSADVSASNSVDITYADCGVDLATAYKAKAGVVGVPAEEDKIDAYLVGDCETDLVEYLNEEQFLHEGQHATKYVTPDPAHWSDIVVGEGIYFQPPLVDAAESDAAFRAMIDNACSDTVNGAEVPRHCIVRRTCASCQKETHHDIYYKRLTDLPPVLTLVSEATETEPAVYEGLHFLDMFMNNWGKVNNLLGEDFKLYGSYEDALADTNEWTYCTYQNSFDNVGFPRNCGPTTIAHDWNSYLRHGGYAEHHGFYVEI